MTQSELFATTEKEIKDFRALLTEKLGDRDNKTAKAIDRNDSWGDIANAARSDLKDPALSDIHYALHYFVEYMQASEDSWEG